MKKIIGFFLALLMLTSAINFNLSSHICGDRLVDVSLFGSANNCGMDMLEKDTITKPCRNSNTVQKKPCCKDQNTFIASQEVRSKGEPTIHPPFFVTYISNPQQLYTAFIVKKSRKKREKYIYSPPNLNSQSILQVFRI
jgi:hypothetical protein